MMANLRSKEAAQKRTAPQFERWGAFQEDLP